MVDFNGDGCPNGVLSGAMMYRSSSGGIIAFSIKDDHSIDEAQVAPSRSAVNAGFTSGSIATTVSKFRHFGMALASLGDVDGDGQADVLSSTMRYDGVVLPWVSDSRSVGTGAIVLLSYNSDLLISRAVVLGDISSGINGMWPSGLFPAMQGSFGASIAASDLDGDGLTEVAVGLPEYRVPFDEISSGDVYRLSGKS